MTRRPRRRGRGLGLGLPYLLAQVLRREADNEGGVRAGDKLRPAVGRFDRAARGLEPEVDQIADTQQANVDRWSPVSWDVVGLAHAALPPTRSHPSVRPLGDGLLRLRAIMP